MKSLSIPAKAKVGDRIYFMSKNMIMSDVVTAIVATINSTGVRVSYTMNYIHIEEKDAYVSIDCVLQALRDQAREDE